MKKFFIAFLFFLLAYYGRAIDTIYTTEQDTIHLDEVVVLNTKKYSVIKSKPKKVLPFLNPNFQSDIPNYFRKILSSVKVDKNKRYHLKAISFYFNHEQGLDPFCEDGIYIYPIIYSATNSYPDSLLLKGKMAYHIDNNVKELQVDISKYNLTIKNRDMFFIGFERVMTKGCMSKEFRYNTTMFWVKKNAGITYMLPDKMWCDNCPFRRYGEVDDIYYSIKYKLFYLEK